MYMSEAMFLGVLLDSLSGKCFYHLRQIRTVRRSLTKDAAQTLVHAFISSRIDYCNSILYGMSAVHMQPLLNVLNAAARVVLQKRKFDHITNAVRDQLHWLPVAQRIAYKLCMHVYKCLRQCAPSYLADMCLLVSADAGRSHLRSAAHGDLVVPRSNLKTLGQLSFLESGPSLWNSLPLTTRDTTLSMNRFCALLKTELFGIAYTPSS